MKSTQDLLDSTAVLHEKLSAVSSDAGVYIFKDAQDHIIYVGKARNLKKRLSYYFKKLYPRSSQMDLKTTVLVKKIADFETILTHTEKEALILESNLIKRHQPRYNVILKDGKRYPSLRLDVDNPYPNLTLVRKIKKDGALYFGPFASASAVHQTLKVIHKTFRLRKCKAQTLTNRSRPCLNHQMDACLAPCCLHVDKQKYDDIVKEVIMFLKGRTPDLVQKIKKEMTIAAQVHDFEKAAVLRDKMFALEQTLEKQVAVTNDFKDRDVLALARSSESSLISLLVVRGGFLLGTRQYIFSETMATPTEMISAFIRQYYDRDHLIPQEILVPQPLEDAILLEDILSDIKCRKIRILQPQRGEKARLIDMAIQNAENSLENFRATEAGKLDILVRLQKRLKIKKLPQRVECFDCSNISGTEAVGAMVVFEKGRPKKSSYRKYRIKTVNGHDDYAYLAEVLKRRFAKKEKSKPYPDILMVDGGKGQLGVTVAIVKDMNLEGQFEIISIAKKDEKRGETHDKIYKFGQSNPVNLGREGDLLLFLQQIRDEAHRFAISFHRKRRSTTFVQSALDKIPGIGKTRKAALLKHFGSIQKIRTATLEDLGAVPGINQKLADKIQKALIYQDEKKSTDQLF
jgi:excinuclease ABC subunit C